MKLQPPTSPDPIALNLVNQLKSFDKDGLKIRSAIRKALDQAYDGQHTGRFSIDQLSKTEAAHIGSLVEIHIRRALDGFITDGEKMDFSILGWDVDCKYSKRPYGWMIPTETIGHYAMLIHADDKTSHWHLGIVHVTNGILTKRDNRDQKRTISAKGRESIVWAWSQDNLPKNILLRLQPRIIDRIFSHSSGQQRINDLFRLTQGQIVSRNVIATVAQQADYMKRVRYNGGARTHLQKEGIVILSGDYDQQRILASTLGLPTPQKGEMVAARLSSNCVLPASNTIQIEGRNWRLALDEDPVEMAPRIHNRQTSPKVNTLGESTSFGFNPAAFNESVTQNHTPPPTKQATRHYEL